MDDLGDNGNDEEKSDTPRRVPLVNTDLHYYARRMINKYIDKSILPKTGNTVIRFDAHSDTIIPEDMSPLFPLISKSIRPDMYADHSKEIWMEEAIVQDGSLGHIIWLKPPWAKLAMDGHRTLENGVTIDVKTVGNSIFGNPDNYEDLESTLKKYLKPNDPYILDLAFCFFSSDNPAAYTYKKSKNYGTILKDLFTVPMPENNDENNVEEAVKKRYEQLNDLQKIFYFLHEHGSLPDPENYCQEMYRKVAELKEDLLQYYPEENIWWNHIYHHGISTSDYFCPVHYTSRENILKLIDCVGKVLDILETPPSVIILGVMYDYDRYTPRKNIRFITRSLEKFFKSRFDIDVEYLDY